MTHRRLVQQYRQKVIDNKNVNNHRLTIVRTYSGALAGTPVPARWNSCSGSLELLFRLAGIHVFLILQKNIMLWDQNSF
jgi:hypothetical protein